MKNLAASREAAVEFGRFFPQSPEESGPVGNQQRPHLAQPGIIFRQDFQHGGVVEMVLENPAFLVQNPVVFPQGRVVIGAKLT